MEQAPRDVPAYDGQGVMQALSEAARNRLTEAQWQSEVMAIAKLGGWWCYHTHDSRRSQSGWPDLAMLRERLITAELKRVGGRLSTAQVEVAARLERAGVEHYLWDPGDRDEVERVLLRQPNMRGET